jgi:hypothetical protein
MIINSFDFPGKISHFVDKKPHVFHHQWREEKNEDVFLSEHT